MDGTLLRDGAEALRLTAGVLPPLALRFAPVPFDDAEARLKFSLPANLIALSRIFSNCV